MLFLHYIRKYLTCTCLNYFSICNEQKGLVKIGDLQVLFLHYIRNYLKLPVGIYFRISNDQKGPLYN